MSVHTLQRLHLSPLPRQWEKEPSLSEPFFISIEPVNTGLLRLVVQGQHTNGSAVVLSRLAKHDNILPQDCYRWWRPVQANQFMKFMRSWIASEQCALVTENQQCRIEAAGVSLTLTPVEDPTLIFGDPSRMGLETDLAFEIETKNLMQSIGFIRGKGRAPHAARVDVLIHNAMPVRAQGIDLGYVRVLTLKRSDTHASIDLVAKCSGDLLESGGVRFSLIAALRVLQGIPYVKTDLVRIGFDLDDQVCWAGIFNENGAIMAWHIDESLQAMTAKACIAESCSAHGN